jgi:hypothetical protein
MAPLLILSSSIKRRSEGLKVVRTFEFALHNSMQKSVQHEMLVHQAISKTLEKEEKERRCSGLVL